MNLRGRVKVSPDHLHFRECPAPPTYRYQFSVMLLLIGTNVVFMQNIKNNFDFLKKQE